MRTAKPSTLSSNPAREAFVAAADLPSVCKAAGLSSVPPDEFSAAGDPLRATILDGEFIIYSVAEDDIDDGARLERNVHIPDSKGDWLFRLPRPSGGEK